MCCKSPLAHYLPCGVPVRCSSLRRWRGRTLPQVSSSQNATWAGDCHGHCQTGTTSMWVRGHQAMLARTGPPRARFCGVVPKLVWELWRVGQSFKSVRWQQMKTQSLWLLSPIWVDQIKDVSAGTPWQPWLLFEGLQLVDVQNVTTVMGQTLSTRSLGATSGF